MPKKPKKEGRKKHANIKSWKFYEVKGGELIRKRKTCPRCKCFMAETGNRSFCGGCGYTVFTNKKE